MQNLRDRTGRAASGSACLSLAAFALLLAVTSGAGRATAADVRPFQLTDVNGFVELGFLTHLQDRRRTISPSSALNRVEFSQLLNVNTRAYIYHPSFLTFQGGFQVEFIEDVLGQVGHRILPGGDFRFNFLQDHRNSASIFGKVVSTEQVRPFSETYDVLSQLYGATFYQKWGWIPFSLTFQHRSLESSGSGGFDDSAEEILFRGRYGLGEQSWGGIDYTLSFEDRRGTDVRRQDLAVTNTAQFGDQGNKRLFTNLFFNEQIAERDVGESKRYAVDGRTSFDWRHSDHLWTKYRLAGRWSDFGSQSVTTLNPSFLIGHELYESLRSEVEIFGRLQDATTGSRNEIEGSISEDYVKRLGGWGRLNLRAVPRVSMTYQRPKEDSGLAVDEGYVMTLDQPVRLRNEFVVEETIVVTNEDGSIEYEEGLDYIVISLGGGFETLLELVPFSAIADGELVLVSYSYELGRRSDILNTSINVGASLTILERLALFGRYVTVDQNVLSGKEQAVRTNPYDRTVVGLQLTWPWLSARAEFEDYDATFAPFRGYLGTISVSSDRASSWPARCSVGYYFRDFSDTGETSQRLTASAAVRKRVLRRGQLEFEARYRRVRWSGEQKATNNIDALYVNAGFSWWYARIDMRLEAGMVQIFRGAEDKSAYRVDLRLRRPF